MSTEPTPEIIAAAVGEAMWSRDHAPHMLGMALAEMAPGRAVVTMTVREDMTNGHGTCHGGLIFALADTAFAYACNSGNQTTVASGCGIDFLAPGRVGDVLHAAAEERSASGRTGVYDVTVTRADGTLIALFRGKSYRVKGAVVPDLGTAETRPS